MSAPTAHLAPHRLANIERRAAERVRDEGLVLDSIIARGEAYSAEVALDTGLTLLRVAYLMNGLQERRALVSRMAPGSRGLGRKYFRISRAA